MTAIRESYTKISYDLRPNKQVERRIIIHALQIMSQSGLQIGNYQYTGMGSIFYMDYIMFHKYLGINKMMSVEKFGENKRAIFNRPFGDNILKIKIGQIGDYITKLSPTEKHLLWLDYDYPLIENILADVKAAAIQLPEGSIILITLDLEMDEHTNPYTELTIDLSSANSRYKHYEDVTGDFFQPELKEVDFERPEEFHYNTVRILYNAIKNGLYGRDIYFIPLFNFSYTDGNKMLTFGGIFGTDDIKNQLIQTFNNDQYIRMDIADKPFNIKIPILTRKEKLYIDSHMPNEKWVPDEDFILEEEDLKAYRTLYRFYPSYVEMLL